MSTGRSCEEGDALVSNSLGNGKRVAAVRVVSVVFPVAIPPGSVIGFLYVVEVVALLSALLLYAIFYKWPFHYFLPCPSVRTLFVQGNSVQCSARINISHRFVLKLQDGYLYSLKNFSFQHNREKFRVRKTDPHTISLEGYIVVKKLSCDTQSFLRFHLKSCHLKK